MPKNEVLKCDETEQPIKGGQFLAGRRPDSKRVFTFQPGIINRIPQYEREESPRNIKDGGMNFYTATSNVDEQTGQCVSDGLKIGKFAFALPPNAIVAYLKMYSRRHRKF
jgi:hypothetical protein